ncbi:MAG: tRNA (adenosine(37)-N6)-dimethylallyltransferase MiaA [Planctomycetota bacterium]
MIAQPVYVLVGLTASGKKRVGIRVAKAIDAEIISLDSIKIYRGMDIGSAKPSMEDREKIRFHLIDILDPSQSFSVGQFLEAAAQCMKEIQGRGRKVLFLGGTAFYLNCLMNGLIEGVGHDPEIRRYLLEHADKEGPESLHRILQNEDPPSASSIHPRDTKRIVRALEVIRLSCRPLSWLKENQTKRFINGPFRVAGLQRTREDLKARIISRAEKMIEKGLVEEVRHLLETTGFGPESGKAIGYKEIIAHLKGELSLDEAAQKINTATWRFAKRQMTWYKRFNEIRWFEVRVREELDQVADAVSAYYLE